jgi:hypothetical protein
MKDFFIILFVYYKITILNIFKQKIFFIYYFLIQLKKANPIVIDNIGVVEDSRF